MSQSPLGTRQVQPAPQYMVYRAMKLQLLKIRLAEAELRLTPWHWGNDILINRLGARAYNAKPHPLPNVALHTKCGPNARQPAMSGVAIANRAFDMDRPGE